MTDINQNEIAIKMKHLEFVQNVISRMNKNSFQLKGWAITILSALLALFASNNNGFYLLVAIVPMLTFWLLDAFYLQQEKRFRGLYRDIDAETVTAFNMEISNYKYIKGDKNTIEYSYWKALFSNTIWPLYILAIVGLIVGEMVLVIN